MKITRESLYSGATSSKDIDITEEQLAAWQQGELIQNVAPHLSDHDREFIMTGITPEEWDAVFGS